MASSPRELFTRLVNAMDARDLDALAEIIHPEIVVTFPQSGERIRGLDSFRMQIENYPGGAPPSSPATARVLGDEERWAISPNYTVVPLASPSVFTIIQRVQYPDGLIWHVVTIAELRDDRVYRVENYFAPETEPAEWRRGMAELLPRE